MNRYRIAQPPRRWEAKLSPRIVRALKFFREFERVRKQHLCSIEVNGIEHLQNALSEGAGILITPNHSTHADADTMYAVADIVNRPFYFMATWHVFDARKLIGQWFLQYHGVFSVDREGVDVQAFKQAVKILQEEEHPLVIFPEGEVYHCNDKVTPFREGAAAIALAAAKRAKRPIVALPCALKYRYTEDPTTDLLKIMEELERRIFWHPKSEQSLQERIYCFADAVLAVKEIEFLGHASTGSLPERTETLSKEILQRLEERYEATGTSHVSIPERVKELRRRILSQYEESTDDSQRQALLTQDLNDIFLVVQLFSYPGDYVSECPSIERLAETLDKFEEDLLGKYTATVHAQRKVTATFAEAVPVEAAGRKSGAVSQLSSTLEEKVQMLLDNELRKEPT